MEFAVSHRLEISVDVHSQLGSGGRAVRVPVREHRGERALSLKLAAEATTATIVANLPHSSHTPILATSPTFFHPSHSRR